MILSDRQKAIVEEWINTNSNILVSAVPGSGKTTTLLYLLEHYCEARTLFLAFNKTISLEIENKIINKNLIYGKSKTIHSLGMMSIKDHYSKVKVNSRKNFDLIRILESKYREELKSVRWKDKVKLRFTLSDINDASRLFLTNDLNEIKAHISNMGKVFKPHTLLEEMWKDFIEIRENSYKGRNISIDFIDMIYLPVYKDLYIPINPKYLMLDNILFN